MATVTFGDLWISPLTDLSMAMAFPVNSIQHAPAVNVGARARAGGNFQMVSVKGKQKTATVALNFLTDAQTAQLKAWQGVLCCYRDPTGEKFYGFFSDSTFTPRPMGDSWVVPLTVQEVTVSEAV